MCSREVFEIVAGLDKIDFIMFELFAVHQSEGMQTSLDGLILMGMATLFFIVIVMAYQ